MSRPSPGSVASACLGARRTPGTARQLDARGQNRSRKRMAGTLAQYNPVMLLAGDVGGTKTLLGIFERGDRRPVPRATHSYVTASYSSFTDILNAFARDVSLQAAV